MYSDIFCKVYNEFGWNYYPEVFGQQLLRWLQRHDVKPRTSVDLACGTGVLCRILRESGIQASGMDFSEGMIKIARADSAGIHYDVADMVTYCPDEQFDLVTCTGDALNHIGDLGDIEKIFRNVYSYTAEGGYFIFDILNEHEVSTSEPFEMDFNETTRVWFQMTRPGDKQVNLKIRVYENETLRFEENIRETIHDPAAVCDLLRKCGFAVIKRDNKLLEDGNPGTTWFVVAMKKEKKKVSHNKLIRDRIPDIIAASGKCCTTEILDKESYLEMLDAKLTEELAEYQESKSLEELADLLEVTKAVVKARGYTWEELERVRLEKWEKRGGFDKRIFLKDVEG